MRLLILCLWLTGGLFVAHAQTYSGRVVGKGSGEPIEGALIYVDDQFQVATDSLGEFAIDMENIEVRALGYLPYPARLQAPVFNSISLEPDPFVLNEVVVEQPTGKRRLKGYPGAVSYISAKEVALEDASIISSAINRIPGVYMHSGAFNTNRITIRGIGARTPFSTNKLRAYLGDIPLSDGVGETTMEDIDLAAVGSISVFKGPNAGTYGNALGGAIQVEPLRSTGKGSISVSTTGGSFGLRRYSLGMAAHLADLDWNLRYNRQSSDGYRDNNRFERDGLLFSVGRYRENFDVMLLGYYVSQFAGIPSSLNEENFLNNPTSAAFTWGAAQGFEDYDKLLIGLTATNRFSSKSLLKTTLYSQFRQNYEPRPFNILSEDVAGLGVRTTYSGRVGASNKFWVGGELYLDNYDWQTFENLYEENPGMGSVQGGMLSSFEERRSFSNLFAQFEHRFNSAWGFEAGLNLNSTSYDLDDLGADANDQSGSYSFDPQLSPRFSLKHSSQKTETYATVSHGFSPPSLEETLTPDGQLNPDIQPETGWNVEAGSRGRLLGSSLGFDVAAYSMRVRNLLVAQRVAEDQFVGINAGSTQHNGIELGLRSRIVESENVVGEARLQVALSDFSFREFVDGENDFSGNELTGVPGFQSSATLDWKLFNWIYQRLEWTTISEMPINDANTVYSDSYHVLNLVFRANRKVGKDLVVDLSYRINNVFGESYASMLAVNARGFGGAAPRYYYPGLPINHQVKLNFTIGW